MNNKVRDVLLVCSLLFNIIIISFLLFRGTAPTAAPEPPQRTRDKREYNHARFEEVKEQRTAFMSLRKDFLAELGKEEVDSLKVNTMLDSLIETQTEMELNIGRSLINMRNNMTAEEAQEFFERMSRRHPHRNHPRRR